MNRVMMLTFAALAVSSAAAQAQMAVEIGPVAGLAITNIVGDNTEDLDSSNSLFFGASIVMQAPASMIGFESGVLYVPKGTSIGDGSLNLTYVEIPLMVRVGMDLQNSPIRPVAMIGGSIGINTGCEIEGSDGEVSMEIDCDDPLFDEPIEIRQIDFGVTAGIGLDIPIGTRGILAPSVRYTRGLTDIDDTDEGGDAKNSAIQIGVAFRFAL